jgi:hypothetical protein
MFERFRNKPEVSPGGSVIYRYPASEWAETPVGLPDETAAQFAEAREEVYARMFGEARSVLQEKRPLLPSIDVYTFCRRAKDGSDTYSLVTSGMSDLAMRTPAGAGVPRRVELIFYCKEPKQEYLETLRWLAHFPHDQKAWIGAGHTIPNGDPPAPFWGSSILDTILFMPTVVLRDQKLHEQLILDGDPVDFLWVVPLSKRECKLKLAKGVSAIYELFDRHQHPHVFDPNRPSYV